MHCQVCGARALPDGLVCARCETPLPARCRYCGFFNAPEARFCGGCGAGLGPPADDEDHAAHVLRAATSMHVPARILDASSGIRGERKQVTVMFADIKGSFELIGGDDVEQAQTILDGAIQEMMDAVHRYGGTVNHIMGDGIMALFGAPVGHEDHALRASYAALDMLERFRLGNERQRRQHGAEVHIRIGLNSGEVVVRAIRNDLTLDYSAVGPTTHLANRMEQLALPGTVRMTAATFGLIEGYVTAQPLGPVPVKGLREPVEVYEISGCPQVVSPYDAMAARGLTPFVGRAAELARLAEVTAAAANGRGQVVGVVGGAGTGKTRLVHHFAGSALPGEWTVLRSGCASFGRTTPWLAVIGLLRDCFGLPDRADPQSVADVIDARFLSADAAADAMRVPLLSLLDVPVEDAEWRRLDPPARRQRTLSAVVDLFLGEAGIRPLLLLVEDLQWADAETHALLERLAERIADRRVLLLVTYRDDGRPGWIGRHRESECRLEALAPDAVEALLTALIGTDPPLAKVKRLLVARADGNPFFLEESVRALVAARVLSGAPGAYRLIGDRPRLDLPATIQAVLAARMDRLSVEDKGLLLAAAVLGADIEPSVLAGALDLHGATVGDGLARLERDGFLARRRIHPEIAYAFRHALIQEVAYASLLHRERRSLHRRLLDVLERRLGERTLQATARLADHAFHGELWPQAIAYDRRVAALAQGRSATATTVAACERALTAVGNLGQGPQTARWAADIRLDLADALFAMGAADRVSACIAEARALVAPLDDRGRMARAEAMQSLALWMTGDTVRAIEAGRQARDLAEAAGDLDLRVYTALRLAVVLQAHGDYRSTVALFHWAREAIGDDRRYDRFGLASVAAMVCRTSLARSLAELGSFDDGLTAAEEGLRIAEQAGHPFSRIYACREVGLFHLRRGDLARALTVLRTGYTLCAATETRVLYPVSAATYGYACALSGRVDEALACLESAVDTAKGMGLHVRLSLQLGWLAEARLMAGQPDQALRHAEEALALARSHAERGHEGWILRVLGIIHADRDPEAAEAFYLRATARAGELGMRVLDGHCRLALARLFRRTRRDADAEDHLAAASRLFGESGVRNWPAMVPGPERGGGDAIRPDHGTMVVH